MSQVLPICEESVSSKKERGNERRTYGTAVGDIEVEIKAGRRPRDGGISESRSASWKAVRESSDEVQREKGTHCKSKLPPSKT